MPRLLPHQGYLLALEGKTQIGGRPLPTKKEALKSLILLTGQHFGFDVNAWKEWLRNNQQGLYGDNLGPNQFARWLDEG
jgi:hypothetical protein